MGKYEPLVNLETCVGCGLCAKDCVSSHLEITEGKVTLNQRNCLGCGHCEAICPTHSISIPGFSDEIYEYEEQTRLDPDTLLKAIQQRRSIRQFKDQMVEEKIIDQILEAGRLAPTGGNSMSNGFIVIKDHLKQAEEIAVKMFTTGAGLVGSFSKSYRNMNIDKHFFFKGAPLAIVITGNSVNAALAAENMAFMAEAYGLGVLYSGFFTVCCEMSGKIKDILQLESGEKPVTTLVIGYPAVKYHRTVHRKDGKIRKV